MTKTLDALVQSPALTNAVTNIQNIRTNSPALAKGIEQYVLSNPVLKNAIKAGAKLPKTFFDTVRNYSQRVAEGSSFFRRALENESIYSIKGLTGKLKDASKFVYSLPGRAYSYVNGSLSNYANGITDYLKYLVPGYWVKEGLKAGAKTAAEGVKGVGRLVWNSAKTPLMYAAGAYVLYKVVKYFLKKGSDEEVNKNIQERLKLRSQLEDMASQIRIQNHELRQRIYDSKNEKEKEDE